MILSRRRFFLGLVAAPAIVHIGNLMPVKAMANLRNLEEERFLESMTVAYSPVWLVSWGEETVFGLFQPGYETPDRQPDQTASDRDNQRHADEGDLDGCADAIKGRRGRQWL